MFSAQEEMMAFDRVTNNQGSRNNSRPHVAAYEITNDALDLKMLNVFEELQPADGSNLIAEMIDRYLLDAAQRVSQIREAAIVTDWLMLKRAAHDLQRRSRNLGVRKVAEICQKLEWVDRHDSPQRVAALVRLLEYESAMANATLATVRQRRLAGDL
jgi:HPt (histidine-containing phosphotransfer) domain-containing protein